MQCFVWPLLLIGAVFVLLSLVRWFEQITDAVDARWWNKTALLLACPFSVWLFPSRVSAGRPTAVRTLRARVRTAVRVPLGFAVGSTGAL